MKLWFLTAALLASTLAEARTLPPTDECGRDASFRAFRAGLVRTVSRRDSRRLLAIIADDIH